MEIANAIRQIAKTYSERKDSIQTEEATKMALIAPFIAALGYNVFDPTEVIPEFIADVGVKKGEKIDYAISQNGQVVMLIECKWHGNPLAEAEKNQLLRYFICLPDTKIAILTNGLEYQFFTDIDKNSQLDAKPYFRFDIRNITNYELKELSKYCKPEFKLDHILSSATELKYTNEIKRYIDEQFNAPEDQFVRAIIGGIAYPGRVMSNTLDAFKLYTKNALAQLLNDKLNERLSSAIKEVEPPASEKSEQSDEETTEGEKLLSTSQQEIDGYNIVKAILCKYVSPDDIIMRDTQSYCGILYKDNNRTPICRLRFNSTENLRLGIIDENKNETRVPINSPNDIYSHADTLIETLHRYLPTE